MRGHSRSRAQETSRAHVRPESAIQFTGARLQDVARFAVFTGEGLAPSPVAVTGPVMQMREGPYGTVIVVPSPLAVMENVPVLLDVYV
jgi:hypothetical protein